MDNKIVLAVAAGGALILAMMAMRGSSSQPLPFTSANVPASGLPNRHPFTRDPGQVGLPPLTAATQPNPTTPGVLDKAQEALDVAKRGKDLLADLKGVFS